MTKALRTASINHNDKNGVRVILRLYNTHDGSEYPYRWYAVLKTDAGEDTEVSTTEVSTDASGATVAQACQAAEHAWGRRLRGTKFDKWEFRAGWECWEQ